MQEIARKVAVVRQEFIPAFGFSVIETVLMARTLHYGRLGFESKTDRELAIQALELTDTTEFASRPLGSLSAGERQRVFIARGLAQNTPILLLDEPTSFLDLKHQVKIYDLLKSIQTEKGTTIVAITHDINLASQYCNETLLLYPPGGSAAESPSYRIGKTSEVLTSDEVERAFDVHVFSAIVGGLRFLVPSGARADGSNLPGRTSWTATVAENRKSYIYRDLASIERDLTGRMRRVFDFPEPPTAHLDYDEGTCCGIINCFMGTVVLSVHKR